MPMLRFVLDRLETDETDSPTLGLAALVIGLLLAALILYGGLGG